STIIMYSPYCSGIATNTKSVKSIFGSLGFEPFNWEKYSSTISLAHLSNIHHLTIPNHSYLNGNIDLPLRVAKLTIFLADSDDTTRLMNHLQFNKDLCEDLSNLAIFTPGFP